MQDTSYHKGIITQIATGFSVGELTASQRVYTLNTGGGQDVRPPVIIQGETESGSPAAAGAALPPAGGRGPVSRYKGNSRQDFRLYVVGSGRFWGLPSCYPRVDCGHELGVYLSCACEVRSMRVCHDSLICACYLDYIDQQANESADRLEQVLFLYGVSWPDVRHIVISPPQEEAVELLVYGKAAPLRKRMNRFVDWVGIRGGVVVMHLTRMKHVDDDSDCPCKTNCQREHYHVSGIHWHVIGWGYLRRSSDVYDKTGWVYKTIRTMPNRGSVAVLMRYLMNHAAVLYVPKREKWRMGNKVVAWVGLASSRYIQKVVERVCLKLCEKCGSNIGILVDRTFVGYVYEKVVRWRRRDSGAPQATRRC